MIISSIQHNMLMANANRNMNINTKAKARSAEKLSSGYKINRAADDAAGLAISEKMRRMIRGLNQGTQNAQDGVSWVQIGDGSLEETHDMLHRMTELAVKASNGTYTDDDRMKMEMEFAQLQKEIDQLTDHTYFNERHIFMDHDNPWYQFEGNIKWLPEQWHTITDDTNTLSIEYQLTDDDVPKTVSVTVPAGRYMTNELIDEIDTALGDAGLLEEGFRFEYTKDRTCNLNLEGGTKINDVSGGLAYLLHDVYIGGSAGALIGTTTFATDDVELTIQKGKNDEMSFDIVKLDGTKVTKKLTIPTNNMTGKQGYTRPAIMKWLQDELKNDGIEVQDYNGHSIKLSSDESIITGLKGNMFKVDNPKTEQVFTSVFYDNIGYGPIRMTKAELKGAMVLSNDPVDGYHCQYHINDSNNTLWVKSNGSEQAVEVKIPEGDYTVGKMADTLKGLLSPHKLTVSTASSYDGGKLYSGLVVTSEVEGHKSEIGIDPKSSAYKTLFTRRDYNVPGETETYEQDNKTDRLASVTGYKQFSPANLPLEVKKGVNDQFTLIMDDKKVVVTLRDITYTNLNELKAGVENAISAAKTGNPGLADLLDTISVGFTGYYNNQLTLSTSRLGLTDLRADVHGTNDGYDILFKTMYERENSPSSGGITTTNTDVRQPNGTPYPLTISTANKEFNVTVGGVSYNNIVLKEGTYQTEADFKKMLNDALPDASKTKTPNRFSSVSDKGDKKTFTSTGTDGLPPQAPAVKHWLAEGTGKDGQGAVTGGDTTATAATTARNPIALQYQGSQPNKVKIDGTNNKMKITVNNVTQIIELQTGEFDANGLRANLQSAMDAKFSGDAGVNVGYSGGLTLTTRKKGPNCNIIFDTTDLESTFLRDMYSPRSRAKVNLTSGYPAPSMKGNMKFEAGKTDSFVFQYNGVDKRVTLDTSRTYSPADFAAHLTTQIKNQLGIPVHAGVSGGTLYLEADVADTGHKLDFDSSKCPAAAAIYSNKSNVDDPGEIILNCDVQDTIKFDSAYTFKITVDGKPVTAALNGTYTKEQLKDTLNNQMSAQGVNVSFSGNSKRLQFSTVKGGATISASYDTGMKPIFGERDVEYYGAEFAGFSSDGKLQLKAVNMDGKTVNTTITVSSDRGSIFQKPKKKEDSGEPTVTSGVVADKQAAIYGTALLTPTVKINQWNNDLTFQYRTSGSAWKTASFALDYNAADGFTEYTYSDLKKALQSKLDGVETGVFEADVSVDGVVIRMKKKGADSQMRWHDQYGAPYNSFSGGFYQNVLRGPRELHKEFTVEPVRGASIGATYAMGRKDLANNKTEITEGVNDVLSLDFTYGGTESDPYGGKVVTLTMKLDPGVYEGQEMADHIQEKLNEQLKAAGLEENLIQAKIGGGINTGVSGSNDANALVFVLSGESDVPDKTPGAHYIIDGIGGNAAFSVFYQTDGDIRVAFMSGSKDISGGVEIPEDSKLSFDVDGGHYELDVPKGAYSSEDIVRKFNEELGRVQAPLVAKMSHGNLTFTHTRYGKHPITNLEGDAKRFLFFEENGEKEAEDKIWIRVGDVSGDGVMIERPWMNTKSLKINSLTVARHKYAQKAIGRLKDAVMRVSDVRSYFGSTHNRLESTIRNNDNKAENTTAAESRIRDADFSKETVDNAITGILEQASASVTAQSRQNMQLALQLLK